MDALDGVVTVFPRNPIIVQKRNCRAQYVESRRARARAGAGRPRATTPLHRLWSPHLTSDRQERERERRVCPRVQRRRSAAGVEWWHFACGNGRRQSDGEFTMGW